VSHNSSFQKEESLICKDNKSSTSGLITPNQRSNQLFSNIKEVQEEDEDLPKKKDERVKFKEIVQQTQMS